jgi:apolipoprotein N-acyltransferase
MNNRSRQARRIETSVIRSRPLLPAMRARFASLSGLPRLVAALLAGAGLGLAQAPVGFPWICFLCLPVLFWLVDGAPGPRPGFWIGWGAGAGYFAATMFWIVEPFLVEPDVYGWMAPFALIGITGGLALFWGAAFAGAAAVGQRGLPRFLMLACCWTLSEYARAHVLTGFPWGLLAYGWIGTPVAQGLAIAGPHGLGFVTLLMAMAPGLAAWRPLLAACCALAALLVFGSWREARPVTPRADGFVVRVVQPNADQRLKWVPGHDQIFYDRLLSETSSTAAGPLPDAVVWPETAVPVLLGERPDLEAQMAGAAPRGASLILGIRRREHTREGEDWYNSLAVLEQGTGWIEAVYDKHHLVPFGEYIPLGEWIARLGLPGLAGLTGTGFARGPGPEILSTPGIPPFLPLICYEAIFPEEVTVPGWRPEWLVQITNDSWFGQVSGPYQHLEQARARAIETGLPMVRSANTGVSAAIDPYGRVAARIDLGQQGHFDHRLEAPLPPTIYSRTGDVPGLIAVSLIFLLTVSKVFSGMAARSGQ